MKPLRFIRAWQTYCVGAIIRPTAAFAQTLVRNKLCEYVEEPKPKKAASKMNASKVKTPIVDTPDVKAAEIENDAKQRRARLKAKKQRSRNRGTR